MTAILFFIIGLLIGGFIAVFFMAGFQLHRVNKYEYRIMLLEHQLKNNGGKGGDIGDRAGI